MFINHCGSSDWNAVHAHKIFAEKSRKGNKIKIEKHLRGKSVQQNANCGKRYHEVKQWENEIPKGGPGGPHGSPGGPHGSPGTPWGPKGGLKMYVKWVLGFIEKVKKRGATGGFGHSTTNHIYVKWTLRNRKESLLGALGGLPRPHFA